MRSGMASTSGRVRVRLGQQLGDRNAGHLRDARQMAARHNRPLRDGAMLNAASLRDTAYFSALAEKPGQNRRTFRHADSVSENLSPLNCELPRTDRFSHATDAAHECKVARMARPTQEAVARRLKAVRDHVGKNVTAMADWLGVPRTRYANWERQSGSGNFPAEESMSLLCDMLPGLTLDYLYRGRLDGMPVALAIQLTAREMGEDPGAPGFDPARAAAAVLAKASA